MLTPIKLHDLNLFTGHTVVPAPAARLRLDANTYRGRRRVDAVLSLTPNQIADLSELLASIERDPALIAPLLRRVKFLQSSDNIYHY